MFRNVDDSSPHRITIAIGVRISRPGCSPLMASQDHGDARQAVALLAKSAYLAEKAGSIITQPLVDSAALDLDCDRCLTLLRSAPVQLQAAMAAVIEAVSRSRGAPIGTGDAYGPYKSLCEHAGLRTMTGRAFGDLLDELDMYSMIRSRVLSRGWYGRTREINLDLSPELVPE